MLRAPSTRPSTARSSTTCAATRSADPTPLAACITLLQAEKESASQQEALARLRLDMAHGGAPVPGACPVHPSTSTLTTAARGPADANHNGDDDDDDDDRDDDDSEEDEVRPHEASQPLFHAARHA